MLFERGANGVEPANNLEELAQCSLPGIAVVVRADAVDQGQAWAASPAQDGHFRFVLGTVGHGAIHYVDNAGAVQQGGQQLALIGESAVVPVLGDKGPDGVDMVRGGHTVSLQPLQGEARALEAGGVHQGVKGPAVHGQRVGLAFAGGAGLQGNGNGVVLREGGHHTGFALVRMPHHGERRCLGHEDSPLVVQGFGCGWSGGRETRTKSLPTRSANRSQG